MAQNNNTDLPHYTTCFEAFPLGPSLSKHGLIGNGNDNDANSEGSKPSNTSCLIMSSPGVTPMPSAHGIPRAVEQQPPVQASADTFAMSSVSFFRWFQLSAFGLSNKKSKTIVQYTSQVLSQKLKQSVFAEAAQTEYCLVT